MPLLTLFTAPKPFTDPHINIIQRNALRNYISLGNDVEVVVIGDEPGIEQTCQEFGLRHLPDVRCNELGTPLISSIFDLARSVNNSPLLMYTNADILFLPDLMDAVHQLAEEDRKFLVVGQRWDLDIKKPLDFTNGWADRLRARIQSDGKLHGQWGSDYFIFPRTCFKEIPDFAVGRAGWDNWMIYRARWKHWDVVDATQSITLVHQRHDYSHLPGGIRHYDQPETAINVEIAGGRQTIFKLSDATHVFRSGKIERKRMNWRSFWREVEIFPLIHLHSHVLGWLGFAVFHPERAYREVRGGMKFDSNKYEDNG